MSEHYDFAYAEDRAQEPALATFLALLAERETGALLAELGFSLPEAQP